MNLPDLLIEAGVALYGDEIDIAHRILRNGGTMEEVNVAIRKMREDKKRKRK